MELAASYPIPFYSSEGCHAIPAAFRGLVTLKVIGLEEGASLLMPGDLLGC